jgi:uncharacterized protein (TIGR02453 family)
MASDPHFTPDLFKFFKQLQRHNNRDWFQANKERYEELVQDPFLRFIEDFRPHLRKISPHFIADPRRSGGSLLRIYRDLRFRPDADPYKTVAAARFPHAAGKQAPAPGFYLHLESGASFLACGLWHPDPETRNTVISAIVEKPREWQKALSGRTFKARCELGGAMMKRMPPGYNPEHPLAADLKRKDFIAFTKFEDQQVCAPDFLADVVSFVAAAAPFMKFLTTALSLPWSNKDEASVRDVLSIESPTMGR